MPTESLFGTPADPVSRGGEDDAPSWLKEEEPTTEPSTETAVEGSPAEAAPETTPAPATDETQATATPPTQEGPDVIVQLTPEEFAALQAAQGVETPAADAPETEAAAEEQAQLYANKYKTIPDLEKGYRERSDMWRRALEAQRAEEAERIRAEQRAQQYEAALRSAIPMLEQAAQREAQTRAWAEQYRQETGQLPPGYTPTAPAQGPPAGISQADVQRMLEERLQAERQQMVADMEQQRLAATLKESVEAFWSNHPEVEPGGALDNEITDAMAELNNSPSWGGVRNPDGSFGIVVDPSDLETLEVVYEAVKRPSLLEVLKLRPDYFMSEAGLQLARREAAILDGVPATTGQRVATVPASSAGARSGQRVPFTESAQGTVPANTSPDQNDPWERIKAVGAKPADGSQKPLFFE